MKNNSAKILFPFPAEADVVALGDLQTYGTGVKPQDAWPKQLEAMTAKTVYSMAYGGYGPVHSLILWDEALAFKPKIIIEAFYAGNDLYDSFKIIYNRGQFPEFKSSDALLQKRLREAEQSEPIRKRASQVSQTSGTKKAFGPGRFFQSTRRSAASCAGFDTSLPSTEISGSSCS